MADDPQYAFRHALVRDVAYAQLPRSARAEKHRLAAEWIARSASRPDLVAHHYTEALSLVRAAHGDTAPLEEPARNALRAAGGRARSLGAFNEAMDLYRRALDLRPADRERSRRGSSPRARSRVAVAAGATEEPAGARPVRGGRRLLRGRRRGVVAVLRPLGGDRELGLRAAVHARSSSPSGAGRPRAWLRRSPRAGAS